MKNIFKKFILIILVALLLPKTSFASTGNQWLNVKDYDKRQGYVVDRGETTQYVLKLYEYISWKPAPAAENTFTDVNPYTHPFIPKAAALGIVKGTSITTFGTSDSITKIALSEMIYNTIQKLYPTMDFSGGEKLKFTEDIPQNYIAALQFTVSRGLIDTYSNGYVGIYDNLTLAQSIKIIDETKKASPRYNVVVSSFDTVKENPKDKPNVDDGSKKAYLTFDDGVSKNTSTILDTLSKYDVKATFFITGKSDVDLLKRINKEGHVIGNHTLSHDYKFMYSNTQNFWQDVAAEEEYLNGVIGYKPTLIRFPGGSNNTVSQKYNSESIMKTLTAQANQRGYTYFDWNVSAGDASGKAISKSQIVSNVLEGSKNKNNVVILMHQTVDKTATAQALPEIIEGLQKMGYKILPLSEDSFNPQFLK